MTEPQVQQEVVNLDGFTQSMLVSGQGPILLLIHGSLCDWRYWRWQLPELSKHFTVLAPSLRHYWPHTDSSGPFTAHSHAHDLSMLLQHCYPSQAVHVLGHSRGAHVALELYRILPDQIQSLSLADPGIPTGAHYSNQALLSQVTQRLQANDTDEALRIFVDTVNGTGTWKKMVPWFKEMVFDNAATLLLQQHESSSTLDLDYLEGQDIPLYFITGENSPVRYAYCMQLISQHLKPSSTTRIAHAAHGMNLANPKAFNQAVLSSLSSLS